MQHTILVVLILATILACTFASPQLLPKPSCSTDERNQTPCVCCKRDCWYTIAAAATHELGHMPGEAGEQETFATLRLIRACMIEECGGVCRAQLRPF